MLLQIVLASTGYAGTWSVPTHLSVATQIAEVTMQERIWLNQGGERVVKRKRKTPKDPNEPPDEDRRLLVFGLMSQPALFYGISRLKGSGADTQIKQGASKAGDINMDGDAVTSPALELQFVDAIDQNAGAIPGDRPNPQFALAAALIPQLEDRGGSQLDAASRTGRWVLPWVGGWERIWTSDADASCLGGPRELSFSMQGRNFQQVSARQFVYGPGEGGIIVEYVYETPGSSTKLLLSRPGSVTNLGENTFQLEYSNPLDEYEVRTNATTGNDALVTGQKLEGGVERAPPTKGLFMRTTYLSERLWILRDVREPERISVFQRTYARSVMDRRGLVMDGQLKPSSDESIRYGRLLFGDTAEDYQGWEQKAEAGLAEKRKLFVR